MPKIKPELKFKNPLMEAMRKLRQLHKEGTIKSLTEQFFLINAPSEYTYVAFKIPKKQMNTWTKTP